MARHHHHHHHRPGYRKLVLHFTVNELGHAEKSVDARMRREMAEGAVALHAPSPRATIDANAGGPYVSERLHR